MSNDNETEFNTGEYEDYQSAILAGLFLFALFGTTIYTMLSLI